MEYTGPLQHTITGSMVDQFLLWAVEQGASDIIFRANDPPWIQIDGHWQLANKTFSIAQSETMLLTNYLAGQEHKAGNVQRGMSADFAYALRVPNCRGVMQRFRVNVTSSNTGHYIVLRALPRVLPKIEDLDLEAALIKHLYPANGIVLVSGVMGSGKSTLLAALIHSAILRRDLGGFGLGRQVLTLEQPIEFDFSELPYEQRSAPISQSEVGRHVESWAHGVRSMTRRKGEIVMVGEVRDYETLSAMLAIVEQGVTCYATVHAQDVPQTVTRIINSFPDHERSSVAQILKANLRLIIHQRLVDQTNPKTYPTLNPNPKSTSSEKGNLHFGRVALREFLVIDEDLRHKLYSTPYDQLLPTLGLAVQDLGQSLAKAAMIKYKAGLISLDTLESLTAKAETSA
ncbi:MAG: Flp pilus assembly complex ATPase component TadA [Desulfovibrionaceae bacterium]|nr:Flp pilus assembly complex ATPase component TadA [Desulfovibrionaceae bacterium]